jgi:hypothetical protein
LRNCVCTQDPYQKSSNGLQRGVYTFDMIPHRRSYFYSSLFCTYANLAKIVYITYDKILDKVLEKMKSGKVKGKTMEVRRLIFTIVGIALLVTLITPATVLADDPDSEHYRVRTVTLADGTSIDEVVINGPPTPPLGYERAAAELPEPNPEAGVNVLSDVPAFNWSFGCSATSAAMIAGYYDRTGYANMYAGPTNGGVMLMDNSVWPDWRDTHGDWRHQCPLVQHIVVLMDEPLRVMSMIIGFTIHNLDPIHGSVIGQSIPWVIALAIL